MTNSDIARIINSAEIQGHRTIRAARTSDKRAVLKRNPLKNAEVLFALNPYAEQLRKVAQEAGAKNREALLATRRAAQKANAIQKKVNYAKITTDYSVLTKADLDQKIASDLADKKAAAAAAAAAAKAQKEAEAQLLAEKEAAKKARAAAFEAKDDGDDDDDDSDEE